MDTITINEKQFTEVNTYMNFIVKQFNELTTKELYEILKSRAEIFIMEQNINYQDLKTLI